MEKGFEMDQVSSVFDSKTKSDLVLAFSASGFSSSDVRRLCDPSLLSQVRMVLQGSAKIQEDSQTIDLSMPARCPENWKVEKHRTEDGSFVFDPSEFVLRTSLELGKVSPVNGEALHEETWYHHRPANAVVLDYLLEHQYLIPDEWAKRTEGSPTFICFFGTIYRRPNEMLCIRALTWDEVKHHWGWAWRPLRREWQESHKMLLFKSAVQERIPHLRYARNAQSRA